MASKFSFEASEQQEIITTYQTTLEETATETSKFIEKITGVAERTRYLPIINLGKTCIDFYNEGIRENIIRFFEEWVEGEASLKAFIAKMEGGDDAEATAENLQNSLKNAIPDMFNVMDTSGLEQIDTSELKPEEEDFDELKDITMEYKNQLEQIKDEKSKIIDSKKDDNAAYCCIATPVASTLTVVISAFEEISNKFMEVKDEFTDKQKELESIASDVAQKTASQAETAAEDAFADISVDFHL